MHFVLFVKLYPICHLLVTLTLTFPAQVYIVFRLTFVFKVGPHSDPSKWRRPFGTLRISTSAKHVNVTQRWIWRPHDCLRPFKRVFDSLVNIIGVKRSHEYFWKLEIIFQNSEIYFLAHLSRRLEWAIVIAHRPSSVRPSSVRPSGVNFSHFRLLLQNRLMDFDETW